MLLLDAKLGTPTPCPTCYEPVIFDGARVVGADLVPGGLYELHGAALTRRRPVPLFDEIRSGTATHGGGFDLHVCPPQAGLF